MVCGRVRELTESLGERNQRRRQVAAVDAGDIPRMQRRQRCRVVPVEKVPADSAPAPRAFSACDRGARAMSAVVR